MEQWQFDTCSPEQTRQLGMELGRLIKEGTVVYLQGGLGAGKTCFAQGVAAGLEVPEELPVTSPTFVIMNQYPGRVALYHFDLYRLSGSDDLEAIGAEELLGLQGACLVEWPQQCDLQGPALWVEFTVEEGTRRIIVTRSEDPLHDELLRSWRQAWQEQDGQVVSRGKFF